MTENYFEKERDQLTLLASRSKADGRSVFPRIPSTSPSKPLYDDIEIKGVGHLYSYTIVHPNPKTGLSPFALGLVDYHDDVRVLGRVHVEPERVKIGMALWAKPYDAPDGPTYCFAEALEH